MKINDLIEQMEHNDMIKVWDVEKDDANPLYEGECHDIPAELADLEVTGIYAGEFFIGIDTD